MSTRERARSTPIIGGDDCCSLGRGRSNRPTRIRSAPGPRPAPRRADGRADRAPADRLRVRRARPRGAARRHRARRRAARSAARPRARSPPAGPGDRGVVVMALGGDGFAVSHRGRDRASPARLREAGAEVARLPGRRSPSAPHRTLLLLTDGLAGDQQDDRPRRLRRRRRRRPARRRLRRRRPGDGRDLPVARRREVLRDAIVGVAIGSDAPLGIGVQHGWRRVGEPVLVTTQRRQPRLHARRPARARRLPRAPRRPAAARTDAAAFTRFALTHPLGLGRRSGEDHVRVRRRGQLRGPLARVHRGGAAGRDRVVHGGRRRLRPDGHRRRVRGRARARSAARRRSASSPSTASRGAASSATPASRARSRGSARPAAARRSRASTRTARSRARAGSAASTTRRSSSWRSA